MLAGPSWHSGSGRSGERHEGLRNFRTRSDCDFFWIVAAHGHKNFLEAFTYPVSGELQIKSGGGWKDVVAARF